MPDQDPEPTTESSGEAAGTRTGRKMPEGRRFSGERARELGRKGAQKRLEKASGKSSRDHVTLPADQADVFQAIREKAKTGNPQAVREYREWLSRLTLTTQEQAENALSKPLEDMTPDELAFADAWAERQIARAARRLAVRRRAGS